MSNNSRPKRLIEWSARTVVTSLFVSGSLLLSAGCTTWVTSESAETMSDSPWPWSSDGDQYYLPMPVVAVTPKIDGSVDVKTHYWANPDERYAIKASTFLGSYNLTVDKDEYGVLEEILLSSTSPSELAQSAAGAAGQIASQRFTQQQAKQQADDKIEQERREEIRKARFELRQAENLRKLLGKTPERDSAVNTARAKLDALLGTSSKKADNADASNGFDSPYDKDGKVAGTTAWGPVFYRVALRRGPDGMLYNVELQPIEFSVGEEAKVDESGRIVPPKVKPQGLFDTINIDSALASGEIVDPAARAPGGRVSMKIALPWGSKADDVDLNTFKVVDAAQKLVAKADVIDIQATGDQGGFQVRILMDLEDGKYAISADSKEGPQIFWLPFNLQGS